MEAPIFIDFPQLTGENISERRAEFFASLSRINAGVETDYDLRRESEKRQFDFAVRFAGTCVGLLIGLLVVALQ